MRSPYDVIVKPIVTEKSMMGMESGRYTFRVLPDANKTEIKIAIEEVFGVKVDKINTMNVKGKVKDKEDSLEKEQTGKSNCDFNS